MLRRSRWLRALVPRSLVRPLWPLLRAAGGGMPGIALLLLVGGRIVARLRRGETGTGTEPGDQDAAGSERADGELLGVGTP